MIKNTEVILLDPHHNNYEFISERLDELNKRNPFGYYFIGASSEVVLEASKYLSMKNRTYVRSNFFAIDEFLVWIFKSLRSGYTFLTPNQEYAIIKSIIREDKSLNNKLSRSPSIVQELVNLLQEINKNLAYKDWDKIDESLKGAKFLKLLNNKMFQNKLIDKAYVYNFFLSNQEKQLDYIEDGELKSLFSDKTLVFYGFLDLPDALKEILGRIVKVSKNNIFYSIYKNDEIFEDSKKYLQGLLDFRDFDNCSGINIDKEKIYVYKFKDENIEQDFICFEIKKLLKSGVKPESISVVVQNKKSTQSLADKMKKYSIPHRMRDDLPLISSKSVRNVLLPYLIKYSGYSSEDIISYMELDGNSSIRDLYIKAKLDFYFTKECGVARKNWLNRLDDYEKFLNRKKKLTQKECDEDAECEGDIRKIDYEILNLEKQRKAINKTFDDLEKYDKIDSDIKLFTDSILDRIDKSIKNIHSHGLNAESEIRALTKLKRVVEEFFKVFSEYEKPVGDYAMIIKELCNLEKYIPTEFFNNTVKIFTIEQSRYMVTDYLFMTGFVNGNYPKTSVKLLTDDEYYKEILGIEDLDSKTYFQTKLYIYLSVATSKEVYFTYFLEDGFGKPYTVSPLLSYFDNGEKVEFYKDKRLLELENALSKIQALSLSKIMGVSLDNFEDELKDINGSVESFLNKSKTIDSFEFDPNKVFSFSQFRAYVECPYKYFVHYLLYIKPKDELSFSVSPLDEGILMHEALYDFMKDYKGTKLTNLKDYKDELVKKLETIIETKYDKYIPTFFENYSKISKEKMKSYAKKIIANEIENGNKSSKKNKYLGAPLELESKFDNFSISGVRFKGVVDRLDKTEDGGSTILDYKPSKSSKDLNKFQLYIYMLYYLKKGYSPLKAAFYSYKTGKLHTYMELKENKIKNITIDEIYNVFKELDEKFKKAYFNCKINDIDESEKLFSLKKDRTGRYFAPCNFCAIKQFCDKGDF